MTHDTESERGLPELLPCPFCGGDDICIDGDEEFPYVSCRHCMASTGPMPANILHEAWNTRAAIEKDRAERSEAVPVGFLVRKDCDEWFPAKAEKSARVYAESIGAKVVPLFDAPPERSDVQGAETLTMDQKAHAAFAKKELMQVRDDEWNDAMRAVMEMRADGSIYGAAAILVRELRASRPAVQQEGWSRADVLEEAAIACEVHAATVIEKGSGTPWSACHECADAIRKLAAAPPAAACAKEGE